MSYFKDYYQRNKEHILERVKKNQKEKYKNDILFNLKQRYQARINNHYSQRESSNGEQKYEVVL